MGVRFRQSLRIAPGLRLNLSKGGVSLSVGKAPVTLNIGKDGARATASLSGTGLSYSAQLFDANTTADMPPQERLEDAPPPQPDVSTEQPEDGSAVVGCLALAGFVAVIAACLWLVSTIAVSLMRPSDQPPKPAPESQDISRPQPPAAKATKPRH